MPVTTESPPLLDDERGPAETDCLAIDLVADATDKPPLAHTSKPTRRAIALILVVVAALAGLVGWLGFRAHQSHQAQTQRNQFLQAAKQGAVNLTTIDWHHAEADVQRILDEATGQFYDDFAKRSKPFVDAVKQVHATTVGTVAAAGLESQTRDTARVLVAASVHTSDAGDTDQPPRVWRLRMFVQKIDGRFKVSNVEFVQ